MEIKSGFGGPEMVSLTPEWRYLFNKGNSTDTKTMWAFFQDQILCQLNRGVRLKEVFFKGEVTNVIAMKLQNFREEGGGGGLIPVLNPPMSSGSPVISVTLRA